MAILVAHRGCSAAAPENTLASLRAALKAGVLACEVDVRATSDGHGRVGELNLEQVKALDAGSWKGETFRGERVPTLKEALEAMREGHLVIEVKEEGINEWSGP